jgi:cysteine desulfurase family protein
MIYLDNAATSWPKPDCVIAAMEGFLREVGASPGRSGHRLAAEAERVRLDAREAVAEVVGVDDPLRVVFMLNATEGLNLVIRGLLPAGSHVVTTGMEHNAVMRPLRAVERDGVAVSVVPCAQDGSLDAGAVAAHVRAETRLIVVNHASNVCGTVLPIREIGAIASERGVPFCVDAAQTVGCRPVDLEADNVDLLAFSGHKGLLGPSGTGGLVFGRGFDVEQLEPLIRGGTGSGSEHEEQPGVLPDKYESGTPNVVGLAGLNAGARYVLERGVEEIGRHERALTKRLIDGLESIGGVRVLGTRDPELRTGAVSFVVAGRSSSEISQGLDERFGIMSRPGLQCAPAAHRTLGTLPEGTVRFGVGPFTTVDEIDEATRAVSELVG